MMKKLIIMLAAIAMVGAFTATAAMADAELYGSARFRTYYISDDPGHPAGVETDKDLEWQMGKLTRWGIKFKSDKITGRVEMDGRARGSIEDTDGASSLGNLRFRLIWGQYDFGPGKLMIGQNYPLYNYTVSSIAYFSGGLQPQGGIAYLIARTSQIRFTFGDFKIAFLTPDTTQGGLTDGSGNVYSEINTTFPRVEASYDFKVDNFSIGIVGGYQTYEIEVPTTRATENINSYVLGVNGKAHFGPGYAGLELTYRQNGKNYGAWTAVSKESAIYQGTDLKDAKAWGVVAALGWKINDMFEVEGNYAKLHSEQDTSLNNEDDNTTWALLAKIHVAPGVLIQPEFIYDDREDVTTNGVSTDEGNVTIFGVWWLINFK